MSAKDKVNKATSKVKRILWGATVVAGAAFFASCEKNNDELDPVENDVRIGWSLGEPNSGNLCDGKHTDFTKTLSEHAIDSTKNAKGTKDIYAYVYCDQGRGPPRAAVTALIETLQKAKAKGVKFEKGTLYVNDSAFEKTDSTTLQNFALTLDKRSRQK